MSESKNLFEGQAYGFALIPQKGKSIAAKLATVHKRTIDRLTVVVDIYKKGRYRKSMKLTRLGVRKSDWRQAYHDMVRGALRRDSDVSVRTRSFSAYVR